MLGGFQRRRSFGRSDQRRACWVTVVSRRESLSARLRFAACEVIYIDTTEQVSSAVRRPVVQAA
jgi:hypothetical protein